MYNPFDFTGKKILVTGASSGIGQAVAIELSKQGTKVVLLARNEERLNETLSNMEGTGHIKICVDLAETEDLTSVFEEITSDKIKLDGLVHCAGVVGVIALRVMTRKRVEQVFRINYYSFLELVKQYSKNKFNNGGSIVGISSVAATMPSKCQTVYSGSKAAMNASVEALSIELVQKNIRINTVMPGFVNTSMADFVFDSNSFGPTEYLEKSLSGQLMGMIEPSEIANVCMFLLSSASSTITGREIYADNCTRGV